MRNPDVMRRHFRTALIALVFLAAGVLIGRLLWMPAGTSAPTPDATSVTRPKASDTIYLRWRMASAYPSELPLYGSLGLAFTRKLARLSNGTVRITYVEPQSAAQARQCFDDVVQGRVQACWSAPGNWYSRNHALILFAGVPFGPESRELLAWLDHGGGQELLDEIYLRFGLKSIVCGVTVAEGGGWFRKRIDTAEDLKGLKMRVHGLAARVLSKLGVNPQRVKPDDLIASLKDGRLDGTEYSMPSIDIGLKLYEVVSHYYFPGWQRQSGLLEVLVKREAWESLPDGTKAMIRAACGENIRDALSKGEAIQATALRELRAKGVSFHTWSPELLTALEAAWAVVVREEIDAEPAFKRVWDSFTAFRAEYAIWRNLGYLKD